MEVTGLAVRLWEASEEARQRGSTVGFVPTMGALHEGHRALVELAHRETSFTVLSVFVNPLQFGAGEDLVAYPRPRDRDLELAGEWGCALAFTPDEAEMYPSGPPEVTIDPGPLGERLEGASRRGHFRGVLTVVAKLLNMVGPCRSYFGEKDAQQLELIRRMAFDLNAPTEVVACPTVRDESGLAISSRNAYLSEDERLAARSLVRALAVAARLVKEGERKGAVLRAEMARRIAAEPSADLDYVAVVDQKTWNDVEVVAGPVRALVAAKFGSTRLIDNLRLPWEPGSSVHNSEASPTESDPRPTTEERC